MTARDTPARAVAPSRIPVPELTGADIIFGEAKHLPPMDSIPDDFKRWHGNPYCDFVSNWFFVGPSKEDLGRLKEREGINRARALAAIQAALASFDPKHEHKIAGCGYLLSQWFELAPEGRQP